MLLEVPARLPARAPVDDSNTTPLTPLAEPSEQMYHRCLQIELPTFFEKADRVADQQVWRDLSLLAVVEKMRELAGNVFFRRVNEQQIFFPLVRELDRSGVMSGHCGSIANSICQTEHEHDNAGATLARPRKLTDGFTSNADACNTHRAIRARTAALMADLRRHVHRENSELFPRSLELEAQAVA